MHLSNLNIFQFSRAVDNILNTIDRNHNDMTIKIWRPFATNAIVHVRHYFLFATEV